MDWPTKIQAQIGRNPPKFMLRCNMRAKRMTLILCPFYCLKTAPLPPEQWCQAFSAPARRAGHDRVTKIGDDERVAPAAHDFLSTRQAHAPVQHAGGSCATTHRRHARREACETRNKRRRAESGRSAAIAAATIDWLSSVYNWANHPPHSHVTHQTGAFYYFEGVSIAKLKPQRQWRIRRIAPARQAAPRYESARCISPHGRCAPTIRF